MLWTMNDERWTKLIHLHQSQIAVQFSDEITSEKEKKKTKKNERGKCTNRQDEGDGRGETSEKKKYNSQNTTNS